MAQSVSGSDREGKMKEENGGLIRQSVLSPKGQGEAEPSGAWNMVKRVARAMAVADGCNPDDPAYCKGDGKPCYVGAGTDDAHWRCGTGQCGDDYLSGRSPSSRAPTSHLREGEAERAAGNEGEAVVLRDDLP